jgi:competence protein ComEA
MSLESQMRQRLVNLSANPYTRAVGLGLLGGLILLAFAFVWRGARDETVILDVRLASDDHALSVYVGGEVEHPGLYTLSRGSRVHDAITAAGGVTDRGDISTLGMAAPLRDADQIIVPSRALSTVPAVSGGTLHSAPTMTTQAALPITGPLNINTASAAELEALPGIGPTLAGRVIDYRQRHGYFRSVDELEAVQGISTRMVEELRPLITVGP